MNKIIPNIPTEETRSYQFKTWAKYRPSQCKIESKTDLLNNNIKMETGFYVLTFGTKDDKNNYRINASFDDLVDWNVVLLAVFYCTIDEKVTLAILPRAGYYEGRIIGNNEVLALGVTAKHPGWAAINAYTNFLHYRCTWLK